MKASHDMLEAARQIAYARCEIEIDRWRASGYRDVAAWERAMRYRVEAMLTDWEPGR